MTTTIRIDPDVSAELLRRRLDGETNPNAVIKRAFREQALEDRLRMTGLGTVEMSELADLRQKRGA